MSTMAENIPPRLERKMNIIKEVSNTTKTEKKRENEPPSMNNCDDEPIPLMSSEEEVKQNGDDMTVKTHRRSGGVLFFRPLSSSPNVSCTIVVAASPKADQRSLDNAEQDIVSAQPLPMQLQQQQIQLQELQSTDDLSKGVCCPGEAAKEDEQESNMSDGNPRRIKTVRFNQETQVLVFETPMMHNDYGASNPVSTAVKRPKVSAVRDRPYNRSVTRSVPPKPRPPALPPRNPVRVPDTRVPQKPPSPPPRSRNNFTEACLQRVRIFRRDPGLRPVTEGLARRGEAATLLGREVASVSPHHRMKVPDTPPPPPPLPPPLPPPRPPSVPSASSASTAPAVNNDTGIRRSHADPAQADDDRSCQSGCLAGCLICIVGCLRCILR